MTPEHKSEPITAESGATIEQIGEGQKDVSVQVAQRLLDKEATVKPELIEAVLRNPTQLVSRLSPNVMKTLPGFAKESWSMAVIYANDLGVQVEEPEIDPNMDFALREHLEQEATFETVRKSINSLYELASEGKLLGVDDFKLSYAVRTLGTAFDSTVSTTIGQGEIAPDMRDAINHLDEFEQGIKDTQARLT